MALDDCGSRFGMNDSRLEQRRLEFEHGGNFDITHAPAVNRAGGRLHRLLRVLVPRVSGCSVWIIRRGLARGDVKVCWTAIVTSRFDCLALPGKLACR